MINLKSSDDEIFQVEVQVAKLSLLVKEMLDDLGFDESEVISMPQNAPEISGEILGKILQWANHHKDDPVTDEDDEKEVKSTDGISSWDAEFLQVDQTVLFQIIRAADYLNITGLLGVTCKTVAKMIKGSTPEEIRRRFNIPNDFTHDEEKQVRIENGWCDAICFPENYDDRVRRVVGKIRTKSSVQDVAHDNVQVIQDCLNTSLVLRKVFQHCSNRELLELACVSKFWSNESRSVMKKRGDVMARLVCSGDPHPYREDIEAFGAVLRQMNVVPFSGVAMEITDRGYRGGTAALDSTCEAILARMPLKLLAVELGRGGFDFDNSSALLPPKKLLQDFSRVLEQLTLNTWDGPVEFFERVLQHCIFPRLKILKLRDLTRISDEVYTSYVKALVPLAPNLKELHVERRQINLEQNVLEGSSAVLVYKPMVSYPFDQISENVMSMIRLEKIELVDTGPDMDFERFNRIIPLLLQAPCTSRLRELWIDEVLAVPLMCYGIRLENVRKLLMHIRLEPLQQEILRIVKNFDFTRIFPNLDEVCVFRHYNYFELLPHHVNTVVEQANAVLREPSPDRAANVKELHLYFKSLFDETAPFFSEMLPTIEKMFISSEPEEDVPFGSIWKHWIDLKELQVEHRGSPIANLDSVFCGIFPEEVAELRQMDEEYLKRVNIVPVMPAITCLKNLQTLTFKLEGWDYRSYVDDGTLLFSKVTGFIAFERCPALAVNVVFWCYQFPQATIHLEPFASVIFESI